MTFLAVVVALFKDELQSLWHKPTLVAKIQDGAGGIQKTKLGIGDGYYFRLWVENTGSKLAERVQVCLYSVERRGDDRAFKKVDDFLPMNLTWTHTVDKDNRPKVYLDALSPGVGHHCDIGVVFNPELSCIVAPPEIRQHPGHKLHSVRPEQTILKLTVETDPLIQSNILTPGIYRLRIVVAASTVKAVKRTIEVNHSGYWDDDPPTMIPIKLNVKIVWR
jgi:hypothetical protein